MVRCRTLSPKGKAWWSADLVHLLYGIMASICSVCYLVQSNKRLDHEEDGEPVCMDCA